MKKVEATIAAPTKQIQRASPDQYTSAVYSATGETYLSIGCSFLCCMPRIRRIRIPYPNGIDTHISSASFRNRNFQTYPISALLFQILPRLADYTLLVCLILPVSRVSLANGSFGKTSMAPGSNRSRDWPFHHPPKLGRFDIFPADS